MPKYELMILVDGDLDESEAQTSIKNVLSLFSGLPDFTQTIVVKDTLAYAIKKKTFAHRFILNFVLDDPTILKKFYEQCILIKTILRYLLINLEKDYGYKASVNPKKIKYAKMQEDKYKKYLEVKAMRQKSLLQPGISNSPQTPDKNN